MFTECPYCEKEVKIDSENYTCEDELRDRECPHCGQYFVYTTYITIHHNTFQAPCLNGGDHKWVTQRSSREQNRMICEYCSEIKSNT